MTDKSFSKRLGVACDQHRDVPVYGHGRQTWIKEQMGVSHEAVRKWFTGESRPRPSKMAELAKVLGVDEAWLALGITPELAPKEKRTWNANAEGAINVFMGLLQMAGAHCAFPRQGDQATEFVSLYSISGGVQTAYHVTLGQPTEEGRIRFVVPLEYERCVVIGAVQLDAMTLDFVHIKTEAIEFGSTNRGGYRVMEMTPGETEAGQRPVRRYSTGLLQYRSITELPVH